MLISPDLCSIKQLTYIIMVFNVPHAKLTDTITLHLPTANEGHHLFWAMTSSVRVWSLDCLKGGNFYTYTDLIFISHVCIKYKHLFEINLFLSEIGCLLFSYGHLQPSFCFQRQIFFLCTRIFHPHCPCAD